MFSALKLFETVNFSAVRGGYEIKEEQLLSGLFVVEMLVDAKLNQDTDLG